MDTERSIHEVEKTFSYESGLYIEGKDELNECIGHIVGLLTDSMLLFDRGSYARSVFISITVIEEVGKTQIDLFVRKSSTEHVKHDPLRDHKAKQIIGTNYTVSMGQRLVDAIGPKMLEHIYSLSHEGKLKIMRERMLYWDRDSTGLVLPEKKVDRVFARALLLFAIESFDDNLVGWTNHSMDISNETDKMFEDLADRR